MPTTTQRNGRTFWEWYMKLTSAIIVPAIIACGAMLIRHEVRLHYVEGTRFTTSDGVELERRLKEELPPEYLLKAVDEIKRALVEMNSRLRSLEIAVAGNNHLKD